MLGSKLSSIVVIYLMVPIFTKNLESSTFRFQKLKFSYKTGTMLFSSSIIKISARTGLSGNPIATPSVCL